MSWNCRGLGNPYSSAVLSHLVREKAPNVLFLMETKQMMDEMRKFQADLRYDNLLVVPCVRRADGLAMLWKDEVRLDVQTYCLNHIDAHILTDPNSPWRLTGFYGRPEDQRKHESWGLLKHLHSRDIVPWVCIGDYNEILSSLEKQGHRLRHPRFMDEFRSALLHCGLVDIGYQGNIFTWRNHKQGEAFVQERLDRACATIVWRELFPQATVRHLQALYSDHDPILLTLQRETHNGRRKKFPKRFEERWATHPECESII
ncbi:uncharacterized protein LOC142635339 [Castanea sativa]|uniref:uncharacterized protein LOC142635339 n=1 Tax=Castanea sativa TaxID=21020 RepID=UPI003F64E1A6